MSDKKNIDRLFREKFRDFEATPSDSVWDNISTELHSSKKRKKRIPIWWRVAGVAAALLLLFTISQIVLNNNTTNSSKETIVDIDSKIDSENTNIKDAIKSENAIAEEKNISEGLKSESSKISSNSSIANSDTTPSKNYNPVTIPENKNVTVNNKIQNDNRNISSINKDVLAKPPSEKSINAIANINDSNLYKDKVDTNINKAKIDEFLNPDKTTSDTKKAIKTTLTNVDENGTESEKFNAIIEEDKLSITEVIAASEGKNIEETTDEEFERWKIASNIAPVYFNTFGKGSSIHPQFNNNSKTGNINMSYGISGSYAINKKLSVRTGVNKVNLGYSTNNVIVFVNVNSPSNSQLLRNVKLNQTGQNISFISVEVFNFAQVPDMLNDFIKSSIDQRLGFIEIPLELKYKISNKKMGINIIGGFSALFLNDNEIYSVLDGNSTLLGKATNINNTSFSANFGLGFDFKILDKFNLNLEPVFKYQLNTFNNTSGNFKPYFIGIYSGLSFKF